MYDEKTILSLLSSSEVDSIREGAHSAGDNRLAGAVEPLVGHLASPHVGIREAADRALRKIGGDTVVNAVMPLLRSEQPSARNAAMDILRFLAPCAVEDLLALLHDPDVDVRIFAADILGSTGAVGAVSPLCHALLQDEDVNVRYQVAISLGALGYDDAVPALIKALEDEEWVQFAVVEALTNIRSHYSLQPMLKTLETHSDLVASLIVDAFAKVGDIKAVPALLKKIDDASLPLCNKIVRALIDILGEDTLPLLGKQQCNSLRAHMMRALEDEDAELQDTVIQGLGVIGDSAAGEAVLQLAATLHQDRDADRLHGIALALARIGYTPALEKAARNGNEGLQALAVNVLSTISHPQTVPLFKDIFWHCSRDLQRQIIAPLADKADKSDQEFFLDVLARNSDGNVLCSTLRFLGNQGSGRAVEQEVLGMLVHPFNDVKEAALSACIKLSGDFIASFFLDWLHSDLSLHRAMAVYVLAGINGSTHEAAIDECLDDADPFVRRVAAEALGHAHPLHEDVLHHLQTLLHDEDRDVRMAAVESLGNCPEDFIDDLLAQGLDDTDPWVRGRCIEKLGERKNQKVVRRLVHVLEYTDDHLVAIKTMEALSSIGGEAAFRALLLLLEHPDQDLQLAAEKAVDTIRKNVGE